MLDRKLGSKFESKFEDILPEHKKVPKHHTYRKWVKIRQNEQKF